MPILFMSSSERVAPGRLHLVTFLPAIVILLLTTSSLLRAAPAPSTVGLGLNAGSPLPANQAATIKATVVSNGSPVNFGTVSFYWRGALLSTEPVSADGVAILHFVFPPGDNFVVNANFNGTAYAAPATSSIAFGVYPAKSLSLSSSGNSSGYTLTAAVTTNSTIAQTGTVRFTDTSTGQILGRVNLVGSTTQSPVMTMPPNGPNNSAVGDFNGDGTIDAVSAVNANGQFSLQVSLANFNGTVTPVVSQPFGSSTDTYTLLATGDFSNDGEIDLVVQDTTSGVLSILLSQGNGQFATAGQLTTPAIAAMVVGDFNNDGNLDMLASESGALAFHAGDGKGGFTPGQTTTASASAASLVADQNADGFLDFFSYSPGVTNPYSGTMPYRGAGDGTTFTERPSYAWGGSPPPPDVQSIATGRFCGSNLYFDKGVPDVAYVDNSTVTIMCNYNLGDWLIYQGQAAGQVGYNIGSHAAVRLTAADINADGNEDLVAFVQDTTDPQAPWNMIVLTNNIGVSCGSSPCAVAFNVSAEAFPDSSGVNFPNTPVPFSTPVVGEQLSTLSPIASTIPFLSVGTATTSTATLSNIALPPGNHTIVATDEFASFLTSNPVQLTGIPGAYEGPGIDANLLVYQPATYSNGVLQLTDGGLWEASAAYSTNSVNVQSFTTTFTFQLINAQADGFTFVLIGAYSKEVGANGGFLGYGGSYGGITSSVALKFDLFDNAGEGNNSIGLYSNGASPTVPSVDMTGSGVDLHSGDVMKAQLIYDGAILHVTLTDTNTQASFQHDFPIDIPATIGSKIARAGFTGATGGIGAIQQILSWTYQDLPYFPSFAATPSLKLNGGAAVNTSSQTLHLIDANTPNQASSAWFPTAVPINQFTNDFTFVGSAAQADGITFTIQNTGPAAVGPSGGGLGYGPDTPGEPVGIANSVAIKFDLFDNQGEGINSTGIFSVGDSPTIPAIDLSGSGIDLHNGNPINVHMVYDGSTITMVLTDIVTQATWTHYFYGVNLPALVGAQTAYIGFTGGTGGLTANEDIKGWTYLPSNTITSPVKTF